MDTENPPRLVVVQIRTTVGESGQTCMTLHQACDRPAPWLEATYMPRVATGRAGGGGLVSGSGLCAPVPNLSVACAPKRWRRAYLLATHATLLGGGWRSSDRVGAGLIMRFPPLAGWGVIDLMASGSRRPRINSS